MPILPERPSLEHLKKQAKALLKSAHAGEAEAHNRIGPFFGDPATIALQQAQLVIARDYGFSSWTALKRHVESGATAGGTLDELATRFLDLACLAYRQDTDPGPHRFREAASLLAEHPQIAEHSIHTAAVLGDADAIDRWLDRDPGLLEAKAGFYPWEPLMYAAYARVPERSSLPAAERLVAHGANPNAHTMWGGQYRFTALTGVFGEGEGGPENFPEHPQMDRFARMLLQAGASPNDSQAAYNTCFTPDNRCLELLLEHGLAADDQNNWYDEDGVTPHPAQTVHFHLILAIRFGNVERAKLLIDHGVDMERPDDTYDTMTAGMTAYRSAVIRGQPEIAAYLLAKGARRDDPSDVEMLGAALLAGNRAAVDALLAKDPDLAAQIPEAHQIEMVGKAAEAEHLDALRMMIELGFTLDPVEDRGPIHAAAFNGKVASLELLIAAGVDPSRRERSYFAAAIGHALHNKQESAIAYLDRQHMDIFSAAARGRVDLIEAELTHDPNAAHRNFRAVRPGPGGACSHDWATPLLFAVQNGQIATARILLDHGADPDAKAGERKTIRQLAAEMGDGGIMALMPLD